ncbi:hypothetical protein CcI49_12335 [Frankia sp. CcI49]|nr:hypothetical protein CcI49_12335 [Frankia sp. CcI49]
MPRQGHLVGAFRALSSACAGSTPGSPPQALTDTAASARLPTVPPVRPRNRLASSPGLVEKGPDNVAAFLHAEGLHIRGAAPGY